mgnify:CR=1 FL=1|jgi:hypothetical protein
MFAAGVLTTSTSCKDYLDKSPMSDISETDPYKNFTNFQGFTEGLYNCIPLMTTSDYHSCWNFGEEEYWQPAETRLFSYAVDQGNYWGWNECYYSWFKAGASGTTGTNRFDKGHLWGMSWYGIRKANLGLENLENMVDATTEEKNLIAGQLYFFRGLYHFLLMQYWGGLPYLDHSIPADAVMKYPRLNYQETAEKAAADFRKAADLLPVDWDQTTAGKATAGNNVLRINKGMALAFLGKDLLYAGSPLMNKESTGSATYNADYCKRAAEVFGEFFKMNDESQRYELADFSNYQELFYTYKQNYKLPGLKEAIFYENVSGDWRWNMVNDFRPSTICGSGIKCYPTANYADYFGMANGKPIKDITKKDDTIGYDPEYPYRNRDPRFYNDFVIDGDKCVLDATKVGKDPNRQYASLYEGGKYRVATASKDCFTGYLNKKFDSQYMNDWDGYKDNNKLTLSMIRLADVYLMYAEAVAEGYGSPTSTSSNYTMSALAAVNKIRERAGVADIAAEYTTSLDGFMSELRRERAVELAFEGHRFNDLRRWLLLDKAPYTQKKAVYFDRATDQTNDVRFADPKNGHVLNLREEVLSERKFTEKHYWFPFLKDDVKMYTDFKQNPGW